VNSTTQRPENIVEFRVARQSLAAKPRPMIARLRKAYVAAAYLGLGFAAVFKMISLKRFRF